MEKRKGEYDGRSKMIAIHSWKWGLEVVCGLFRQTANASQAGHISSAEIVTGARPFVIFFRDNWLLAA